MARKIYRQSKRSNDDEYNYNRMNRNKMRYERDVMMNNNQNEMDNPGQDTITCQKCQNNIHNDKNIIQTPKTTKKYKIDEISRTIICFEFLSVAIFWCFYWYQAKTDGCDGKIEDRINHIMIILTSGFLCKSILISIPYYMNCMHCIIFIIGTLVIIPIINETTSIITNVRDIDVCTDYFKNYLLVSLSLCYFLCLINLLMILKAYLFIIYYNK